MSKSKHDAWSDERKLSALIVIATAKRIGKVRWLLSREEYALVLAGHRAFEDGRQFNVKERIPSGELGPTLQHALDLVLGGLKDFPAAGQTTNEFEARRFPLDGLPYTLFYRHNRAHANIDVLAVKREPQVYDLRIMDWLEEDYPADLKS